ncbi:putative transporter [Psilocybe cubensis]|uniref:Transporter n=1 Tax=Psilocybe cubensis TaxID=181762 RepID=A0ACB8GYH4_PSICU|nr:putative transporter [Psilocybe cubensis]KAH9480432.1 putative transporter [Psilocybe cubensis]
MATKAASEKGSDTTINDFDTPEDRALVRKIDLRLLPILTLLYLLSFLDRTNIGNAKIVGLTTDLHVSPPEYNTALALYFVAYVIFEVPANSEALQPTNLAAYAYVVLGNREHMSGPGREQGWVVWDTVPHERSWRVAIFFGGAALAGAFGGILAYAIGKMDGVGGRKGWEWIFILEGILTVAIALVAYFIVPTWSHKAKFLTESEKARLFQRLNADSDAALIEKFEWVYVKQALTDHLVWGYAMLFHGFAFVLYSLSLFLPTIIAGLGFESWQAQLMTVPPNSLAAISIWVTVWFSSKYNARAPFILGAAVVAIIGYIILLTTKTAGAQYVGVLFAAAGVYTGNALLLRQVNPSYSFLSILC